MRGSNKRFDIAPALFGFDVGVSFFLRLGLSQFPRTMGWVMCLRRFRSLVGSSWRGCWSHWKGGASGVRQSAHASPRMALGWDVWEFVFFFVAWEMSGRTTMFAPRLTWLDRSGNERLSQNRQRGAAREPKRNLVALANVRGGGRLAFCKLCMPDGKWQHMFASLGHDAAEGFLSCGVRMPFCQTRASSQLGVGTGSVAGESVIGYLGA